MSSSEIILEVGAEGGSVTLYGLRTGAGWLFSRKVIDQTPMLLDEPAIKHESEYTTSWIEALKLLDPYPWCRLKPVEVHPDFRDAVLDAVMQLKRAGTFIPDSRMEDWEELCQLS